MSSNLTGPTDDPWEELLHWVFMNHHHHEEPDDPDGHYLCHDGRYPYVNSIKLTEKIKELRHRILEGHD